MAIRLDPSRQPSGDDADRVDRPRAASATPGSHDPGGEWLTIHEASAIVGVSPATLRRWCDAGTIKAYATPGGHRRFARSAVLGLLPSAGQGRRTLASVGETPESITGAYRREVRRAAIWPRSRPGISWRARESFRACGFEMVSAIVGYLEASCAEERALCLATAESAAACYGRTAARHRVGMRTTIELFLRVRAPFLRELGALARRRALDATEATSLLEAATDAIDRIMPAAVAGYEEAEAARRLVGRQA